MAQHKIFVGTYRQYDGIEVTIRRTCVVRRHYTHAIIPYYTTRSVSAPVQVIPTSPYGSRNPVSPGMGKRNFAEVWRWQSSGSNLAGFWSRCGNYNFWGAAHAWQHQGGSRTAACRPNECWSDSRQGPRLRV